MKDKDDHAGFILKILQIKIHKEVKKTKKSSKANLKRDMAATSSVKI